MNTKTPSSVAVLIPFLLPILGLVGCAAPTAPQGAVIAHVIANFES